MILAKMSLALKGRLERKKLQVLALESLESEDKFLKFLSKWYNERIENKLSYKIVNSQVCYYNKPLTIKNIYKECQKKDNFYNLKYYSYIINDSPFSAKDELNNLFLKFENIYFYSEGETSSIYILVEESRYEKFVGLVGINHLVGLFEPGSERNIWEQA